MNARKAATVIVAETCAGLAIAVAILLVGLHFHRSSQAGEHTAGRPAFVKELPESYADAWIDLVVLATLLLVIVTAALAIVTYLLYSSAAETARDAKEASAKALEASTEQTKALITIERAFVAGGGGTKMRGFTRCFGVDVGNYGRTAAFLRAYDVQFATLDEVKSYPCSVSPNYPWDDQLPPGQWKGGIDYIPIPPGAEVVYGAFWYEDSGQKMHLTRFILSIGPHTTRPDVAGVDDMYRYQD